MFADYILTTERIFFYGKILKRNHCFNKWFSIQPPQFVVKTRRFHDYHQIVIDDDKKLPVLINRQPFIKSCIRSLKSFFYLRDHCVIILTDSCNGNIIDEFSIVTKTEGDVFIFIKMKTKIINLSTQFEAHS